MVIKNIYIYKRKKPHECCGSVPPLAIAIGGGKDSKLAAMAIVAKHINE
jgi:hypothetical protein